MKTRIKILMLSLLFGIFLILLIAVINDYLFKEGSEDFIEILLTDPPTDKIIMRIAIMICFIGYGFVISNVITKRKYFDKELLTSESQLYNLIGNLPGIVYKCRNDENLTMISISEGCSELTGYRSDELIGNNKKSYNDLIHTEDRKYVWDSVQECITKRSRYRLEYRIHTKEGEEKWVWEQGIAVLAEDGTVKWLEGYITDITAMKKAEFEIREKEENLSAILKVAPIGIGLVENRVFRQVNDYMCRLLGYSPGELIGRRARIIYPDDKEFEFVGREKYKQIEEKGTGTVETRWVKRSGEIIDVLLSSTYLDNEDINKGTVFTALDITEKKKSERMAGLLSQGIEHSSHSILITDRNGITEYVNKKFIETSGYSSEEAIGKNANITRSDYHSDNFFDEIWNTIKDGREWIGEIMNMRKNGELYWEQVVITPIKDSSDVITHYIAIKEDITEKKKNREQIIKLNRIYSVLSNINQVIVRVRDRQILLNESCRIAVEDGKIKLAWIGLLNKESGQLEVKAEYGMNNGFIDFVVKKLTENISDCPCYKPYLTSNNYIINDISKEQIFNEYKENALSRGFKSCGIFPIKVRDEVVGSFNIYNDEINFFDEREISLLDELTKDIGYALDFIEQEELNKRIHEALRLSEEKYKTLIENANEGIAVFRDLKVLYANNKFSDITGYTIEELSHISFVEIIHPADLEKVVGTYFKRLQNEDVSLRYEFRLIDKEGRVKWVEVNSVRINWESKSAILSFYTDRTVSKTAELALRENEELLSSVLSMLPVGIWFLDKEGKIYNNNEAASRIWAGARYVGIDEYSVYKAWWAATGEEIKPQDWAATRAIKYGERSINEEIKIQCFDGTKKIILNSALPLFDEFKNIKGVIIVNQDITYLKTIEQELKELNSELEKKIAERTAQLEDTLQELKYENEERRRTQDELLKAREELIAALKAEKELSDLKSRFISLVSHEYRTPLTVILSSSYLLDKYFNLQNKKLFATHLKKIQDSVERMTHMLDDILTMSKIDAGKIEVSYTKTNLVDLIKSTIEEISFIDKNAHKFTSEYQSEDIVINTDQFLLRQIVLNLLSNSVKFSNEGTEIIVEVSKKDKSAIVKVIDFGAGIPEEEHNYIFEPFHRAKNTDSKQGTGLGLAIVKRFAEILGCNISFESALNKGTTFYLIIPE